MNNTEKLLRAFIKAQGYAISEYKTGEFTNGAYGMGPGGVGSFTKIPVTDYKVTKKDDKAISIITRLLHEIETDCNGPSMELFDEARSYVDEKD